MSLSQFEVVEDTSLPSFPQARASAAKARSDPSPSATDMALLQLRVLAQRAAVAAASLIQLLTVASVFWLALQIIPRQPSIEQLVGLAGYAVFVLVANWLVARSRA
jgi:hypothetical protein